MAAATGAACTNEVALMERETNDQGQAVDTATAEAISAAHRSVLRGFVDGSGRITLEEAKRLYGWDKTEPSPWLGLPLPVRHRMLTNVLADMSEAVQPFGVIVVDGAGAGAQKPCYAFLVCTEEDFCDSLVAFTGLTLHIEVLPGGERLVCCEWFDWLAAHSRVEPDEEPVAGLQSSLAGVQRQLAGIAASARRLEELIRRTDESWAWDRLTDTAH